MNVTSPRYNVIREGLLNRFYTLTSVGELLTDLLENLNPSTVVDLGAGHGSLSASVAKCWPDAQFLTVDIDDECQLPLKQNIFHAGALKHKHQIADVFDAKLPQTIPFAGSIDLAVCNPPFFRPEWKREFLDILEDADMVDACSSIKDVTAELIFLAQNLRLLKTGGTLAMIAPDGMITGKKTESFRRALIEKFSIECVLQLPPKSFHDTEARCFILVFKKARPLNKKIKIQRFDYESGLSIPLEITNLEAINRLDYDFHFAKKSSEYKATSLRLLGAEIKRGSLSNTKARYANLPVFHTTDFAGFVNGEVSFGSTDGYLHPPKSVVARPGDILLARVDRKLHEKIAIVTSGEVVLTDCVYRIRVPENSSQAVFNALRSQDGISKLLAVSKGVGARLLGKEDLLDISLLI